MILNPGTLHTRVSNGAAVLDMADYPSASTAVNSYNNNPSAVTT